ncbi:glutamic acid-rich protein isoform X2 [Cephus cinctus]|nr:glutamic acid-rich protein isoform X2 [Cephus cinctus]
MKPKTRRTQSKRATNGNIIKTRAKKPNRMCGQCHNTIKSGVDMYRFHSTGVTVCKFCWSTMDPSKTSPNKKRAQGSLEKKKTKLCSVFLTDVMGDASLRDNRGYKIEKDEEGNTTFILMDDSSEEDNSTVKIKKEVKESVPRQLKMRGRKSRSDIDDSSVKSKPIKKLKSDGESSKQTFNPRVRRSLRQKTIKIEEVDDIDSDTIVSKKRNARKVQTQPEKKKKPTKRTSFSDDDLQIIGSRVTRTSLRARKSDVSQSELSASISGSSSGECGSPRRKRKKAVDVIPMTELFEKNVADVVKLNTRSSSISSKESSPSDFKSLEKSLKLSTSSKKSSQKKNKFMKKTIEKLKKDKEEYVCTICNVGYKNKLIGMTHELSHLKQPEVTLCRIRPTSNSDKMKVTATTESTKSNVNNDVSLEEQSHDISSTSDALREKVNRETAQSGSDVISLKQKEDSSKYKRVDGEGVAESKDQVSTEEKSAEVELPKEKEVTSEQEKELEKSKDETTQKNGKKRKLCSVVDSINNADEKVEENNKEALKSIEEECKTGKAESVDVEQEKEISEDALKLSVEAKESSLDPEPISQAEVIADVNESRHEVKKNLSESLKTTTKVTPTENVKSTTSNDISVVEDVVEADIQTEVCPTIKELSSKDAPKEAVEADEKENVEKGIEEKEKVSETAPTLSNLNDSITKVPESKELTDDKPEKNTEEDKHVEEEDDDEEIITSIYVADDESPQLEEDEKEDQQKEENNKEASEDIHEAKSKENGNIVLLDTSVKEDSNTNEDTNKESVKLEEVLTKMFEEETPVTRNQDNTQTSKLIDQREEGVPETLENISKEICKESHENEKDGSKNSSIRSSDLDFLKGECLEKKKKIQEEYIA